MIRTLLLTFSLLGLVFSGKQLLGYWDYDSQLANVKDLLYSQVSPEQLSTLVGKAINEDRLEDAKTYLAVGKRYQYPLHYDYYYQYINERDTQLRRVKKNISNFSTGFVTGKGVDASGITGAMTADFTVIGDVRDLYQQYQLHNEGEAVNQLIVGLAGVGIGLTAVTYGSAGTASVAKVGTSTLKIAAKTGRLTKKFSSELVRVSSKIFDWKLFKQSIKQSSHFSDIPRIAKKSFHPSALRPLQKMAKNIDNIRINTSLPDALHMLRYVENSHDLRRLEKFTVKHKHLSKGLLSLLGRGALRSVRILRKTTGFLMSLMGTVVSAIFSFLFLFSYRKH
ncbi:MAG: hypothetical protein V3U84_08840 [Thiotrichaceae bacterium]